MNRFKTWIHNRNIKLAGRIAIPVIAAAMTLSLATYQFAKPASAAVAAPPAAAIDSNSVAPLLEMDKAMEALAARVTPATVNVTVTSKTSARANDDDDQPDAQQQFPFGMNPFGQSRKPEIEHGLGTGVVISPDGYIVTNNHVVDGAVDINVTMSDRRILPAKLIGTDPLTDLAVIKVNESNMASVPWGDPASLRPGQTVLAFGNPFGFRFTVTRGIISALNRPNPSASDRRKPGQFIQTDAAINPGNSGGPLVNARGEVIGINTFLISPNGSFSGMGFAIPVQIVRPTVEALIKYGKVSHGYMGIGISDVTPENSTFFNLKKAEGALVTQVDPNTPGARAGLKTGDVITGLNGQPVGDAGELQVEVGQKQPGTVINLNVIREGKDISVPVTLEAMGNKRGDEDVASNEHGKPRWGLGLADITPDIRGQIQVPRDVNGAVVGSVQPGSPADNAGLQRGDIILEVNRHAVQSASEAAEELGKVTNGKDALVLVWSNGGSTFRVLHPTQG